MAQVFTIRVLYANGYTHDFDVLEFKITDGGEWSWVDANPHVKPLKLGIKHIIALLERMVPVHKVHDLTVESPFVERELALVKVTGQGNERVEALRIADIFRARPVDTTTESFVFEITGSADKVDNFIGLMRPLGLVEVCRTGVASVARGKKGI